MISYPIQIPQSLLTDKHEGHEGEEFTVPPLKERVFHFTKQSIAKLKAKANAEVEVGSGDNGHMISSLQALLAHIWQSIVRNKRLHPDGVTTFKIVVGARPRLPDLPQQYFGNAVKGEVVKMKAKEVQEQRLGDIAWQLNRKIATQTEQEIKKALECWIASPKLLTKAELEGRNVVVTSSSPRFNMYGNDFGWGKPIAVRSGPANKFDGKTTEEEGSIDIEACLSPQTLDAMANDQQFMDSVTI